jgi:hypothetical protein
MSDQPTSAGALDSAAVPQKKAEEVAIVFKAIHADVGVVRAEVAGIRSATTAIQDELTLLASKADMRNMRNDVEALDGRISRLEGRLLMALGVIAGLLAGLLIAAVRYWMTGSGHS